MTIRNQVDPWFSAGPVLYMVLRAACVCSEDSGSTSGWLCLAYLGVEMRGGCAVEEQKEGSPEPLKDEAQGLCERDE